MGLCQGKSCERHVRFILAEVTGQKLETLEPATTRPPVRPLPISFLIDQVEPCLYPYLNNETYTTTRKTKQKSI
ncbi:MAG: hypothetical protein JRG73_08490 [Deltaproteobacteria bacterium]|nr:hypothetical protein [Deltaproteobacteria bacterium]